MPPMTIDRLLSISIGHRDDNLIQRIEIDISSWQSKYPNLDTYRIEMVDAENRKQIALNTSVKDGYLIWIITNKNTAVEGEGSYQVIATGANGQQKASRSAALFVRNRIHGDGQEDAPEYMKPLLDRVAEYAAKAKAFAERAESATGVNIPIATPDTAGIIKVGSGLSVAEDGTLSVCENELGGPEDVELLIRRLSEDMAVLEQMAEENNENIERLSEEIKTMERITVNGIAPDANGNIALPVYDGEVADA